jgi:hypothetical protein
MEFAAREENGTYILVDLKTLINRIRVSPTSKPGYEEVVKLAVARYGLDQGKVERSRLLDPPIW